MQKRLLHIAFVLLLLCACGNREAQRMLDRAEAVMSDNPSEAIAVLDSIGDDGLSRSQHMRRLLLLTNAQNKCDTVFRSDSIQKLLVNYYANHGIANEKMLAYYLLGRARYDIGEIPAALESFQDAASCADTLSSDCDYRLLSRVHGQTARLFLEQEAPNNALAEINKVDKYARLSGDTLMWLVNITQKASAYQELDKPDSVFQINNTLSDIYARLGYTNYAASTLFSSLPFLLEQKDYPKASLILDKYEKESGLFDSLGNIADGLEIYYYYKGIFLQKTGKLKEAEDMFRKELSSAKDWRNKSAALRGLSMVFGQTGNTDSLKLYADKSFQARDSLYRTNLTKDIIRTQAIYDYTHFRLQAEKERHHALASLYVAIILGVILCILLLIIYIVAIRFRHHRERTQIVEQQLHGRLSELEQQLTIKEIKEVEKEISDSPLVNSFHIIAQSPKKNPSLEEWRQLRSLLRDRLPAFWNKLQESEPPLRIEEIDVCLLIRLQFPVKEIANLTGMSIQAISNVRRRLLQRVFHQSEGGSKEFDRLIMKL